MSSEAGVDLATGSNLNDGLFCGVIKLEIPLGGTPPIESGKPKPLLVASLFFLLFTFTLSLPPISGLEEMVDDVN